MADGVAGLCITPKQIALPTTTVTVSMTLILRLLRLCCPSAIARLIIAIIVDTVNAVANWTRAHVFKKGRERVAPPFANSDAPSTVSRILAAIRIQTTSSHCSPRLIGRVGMPLASALRSTVDGMSVFCKATATAVMARAKIMPLGERQIPAITSTYPTNLWTFIWAATDDGKSAKMRVGKINKTCHWTPPLSAIIIAHNGGRCK